MAGGRVGQAAHRVSRAGGRVQVQEAGGARGLLVGVGHADRGAFLQREVVGDVEGQPRQEGQLVGAGLPNTALTPCCRRRL